MFSPVNTGNSSDNAISLEQKKAAEAKAVQAEKAAASASRDNYGINHIQNLQIVRDFCSAVKNITVIDREVGTATANNYPAYIIGYDFICVNDFGNKSMKIYVGWIQNIDSGNIQCNVANESKDGVIYSWTACGGNYKITGSN